MRAELPFSLKQPPNLYRSNQHLIIRACLRAIDALRYWPALMMVIDPTLMMVILTVKRPQMSVLSYQAQRFGETFRYERLYL